MYRELIRLITVAEDRVPKHEVPSTVILKGIDSKHPVETQAVLDHIRTQMGVLHFKEDKVGILRLAGTDCRVEVGCGISYLVTRIGKIPVAGRVVRC